MGWASGSEMADDLWNALRKHIDPKQLKKCARKVIDIFEQQDCDTMSECGALIKDAAVCQSCMLPLLKNGKCSDADCQADQDDYANQDAVE